MLSRPGVTALSQPATALLGKINIEYFKQEAKEPVSDVLVKIESRSTVTKLQELMQRIQCTVPATSLDQSKTIFTNFLKQRWDFIKRTDASYPHSPKSPANLACYLIAQSLAEGTTRSPLSFLMPDVTIPKHAESLKLHEFIITEDNVLISVLDALDAARLDDLYQFLYVNASGVTCRCTNADRDRIAYHSSEAQDYYRNYFISPPSLEASVVEPDSISKEALKLALNDFNAGKTDRKTLHSLMASYNHAQVQRANLVKALANDNYFVKSSYLAEGKSCLFEIVLSGVTILPELACFMSKNLSKEEWQEFIDGMDSDSLYQIVLTINIHSLKAKSNGNEAAYNGFLTAAADRALTSKLTMDAKYFEDEKTARAYFYCLAEAYNRTRSDEPELKPAYTYTGMFSRLASYAPSLTGSYVKDDKVKACKELINFILDDHPLHDLESYLRAKKLDAHWPVMMSSGVLEPSTLAKITTSLILTGNNLLERKMSAKH